MAYIDVCVICKDSKTKNVTEAVNVDGEIVAVCPNCKESIKE